MNVYLPVAELSANLYVFSLVGAAVGFLSGMFGVGGGFLITPILIFLGVPTAVAVGSGTVPVIATSITGAIANWRRGNVDVKMGTLLLLSGIVGSGLGVQVVTLLRRAGQFDLVVAVFYVLFLGVIGTMMLIESINALRKSRGGGASRERTHHSIIHGMPFKMRFPRSKLYMSVIPPIGIGGFVGFLSAIIGVGGGVIMVPAMIYILRMSTSVVIGTSLYQIVFVAGVTTFMQAVFNHNVDVVLALMLMVAGVVGAHFGALAGQRLKGEQLRFLLAVLVLLVCLRVVLDLVLPPSDPYSIGRTG